MDHLPLYRQLQRFKRENIPIALSTLEGWKKQSLDILDILYQHLLEDTRAKGYLQSDETPIKVIDKNKKGTTHQGYYWVHHCPVDKTVLFDYQPGRGALAAEHILSGFRRYLQTDGHGVYDKIGKREGLPILTAGPMPGGNLIRPAIMTGSERKKPLIISKSSMQWRSRQGRRA